MFRNNHRGLKLKLGLEFYIALAIFIAFCAILTYIGVLNNILTVIVLALLFVSILFVIRDMVNRVLAEKKQKKIRYTRGYLFYSSPLDSARVEHEYDKY